MCTVQSKACLFTFTPIRMLRSVCNNLKAVIAACKYMSDLHAAQVCMRIVVELK